MKKNLTTALLVAACLAAGWQLHRTLATPITVVHAQNYLQSSCTVQVPQNWGEFKTSSTSGFVFEDKDGTLRILQNLPCGTPGTPHIDLMIQRSN
jgi:hypothetical protein